MHATDCERIKYFVDNIICITILTQSITNVDLRSDAMDHENFVGENTLLIINNVLSFEGYHERPPASTINFQHSALNTMPSSGQMPGSPFAADKIIVICYHFIVGHNSSFTHVCKIWCSDFFSSWCSNDGA